MSGRVAACMVQRFPIALKYTDIRSYVLTSFFVLLSVLAPWALHRFHLIGPTYLPMHFFVLLAGLLFGWRAGLIVGLFTPLVSNVISGMPLLRFLPQILVEVSTYGLVAGILREKLNLRVIWSLLGAIVGGRVALLIAVVLIYFIGGESYRLPGEETGPIISLWSVVRQGWPGIVIQLTFIPSALWLMAKLTAGEKEYG